VAPEREAVGFKRGKSRKVVKRRGQNAAEKKNKMRLIS